MIILDITPKKVPMIIQTKGQKAFMRPKMSAGTRRPLSSPQAGVILDSCRFLSGVLMHSFGNSSGSIFCVFNESYIIKVFLSAFDYPACSPCVAN